MKDIWNKGKRSELMSLVRSRANKSTELVLMKLFRTEGITGWRRHLRLPGTPDFAFRAPLLAIFWMGVFGTSALRTELSPGTTLPFGARSLMAMLSVRDRTVNRELRKAGWRVIRIWEHDLPKQGKYWARRIKRLLVEG